MSQKNDIVIATEPIDSFDELFLNVLVTNGEQVLFKRMVACNDEQQFVALCSDSAAAAGAQIAGMERQLAPQFFAAKEWWARKRAGNDVTGGFTGKLVSSSELALLNVQQRWLVEGLLVCDQPALLGGPKKSLKTSIMMDLAISLGTGKLFLNRFKVPAKVKVAVLSGESGQATIQETALRIATSKGVSLSQCDVLWGFELPRLGVDDDLMALSRMLRANQIAVVFIDPVYLCMLAGAQEVQAGNLMQMGLLLMRVARVCREAGATMVLVHHTTKHGTPQRGLTGEPLDLEDLAYAGFAEFARQWLLLNRRVKFEPGSGFHQLWLQVGGSAGQSGCWGIDVTEDKLNLSFKGRRWRVMVLSYENAMQAVAEERAEQKQSRKGGQLASTKLMILGLLRTRPKGETQAGIAEALDIQPRVVKPALAALSSEGRIVPSTVKKGLGKGQDYECWKLTAGELAQLQDQAGQQASSWGLNEMPVPMGQGGQVDDTGTLDDLPTPQAALLPGGGADIQADSVA